MSKQSIAKESQGYRTAPKTCGNCKYYTSQIERYAERQKRCTLGNFAVKKMATCDRWLAV